MQTAQDSNLNKAEGFVEVSDGFKMVSQFESEQAALNYATELQQYYDSLKMDVKVQVETNLEELDDTDDKQYIREAFDSFTNK